MTASNAMDAQCATGSTIHSPHRLVRARSAALTTIISAAALLGTLAAFAAESQPIPAGKLADATISIEYAIYFLPHFGGDAVQRVQSEAAALDGELRVVTETPKEAPTSRLVWAHSIKDLVTNYAPPRLESLKYFGRGLSAEQARKVQSSEEALVLDFMHPQTQVWQGLKAANELVEKIARRSGGLIWDDDTRLLYSPEEWRKQRIESWRTPPDVAQHITIHSYKNDDYLRAITLGMSKFGLPDIVVAPFSQAASAHVGTLINALAQSLIEGGQAASDGRYDLDLRNSRNQDVRERQLKALTHSKENVAHLTLTRGKPEEGDPRNRLIEVGFDQYAGTQPLEQQDSLFAEVFGVVDPIARIRHSDALLALSRKAVARLPELHKAFDAGLPPGEFIHLKVPFDVAGGGHEYMWAEVTKWRKDGRLQGILLNEPERVPDLHAGAIVSFAEADVFDYIYRHADGTDEGNETGKMIVELQGE